jgi:DDE superfamily endonuclease
VKVLVISNKQRKILYVSKSWVGKVHDFKLLKREFPPEQEWFKNFRVRVDLGYLGFDQEYGCKALSLPHKKPKKQELSAEHKQENREFARERVEVEHAIGGLKRYRILSDRLRVHNADLYDDVVEVCAGLWNFYLTR